MVHLPGRSVRWSVGLGWMVSLVAALLVLAGCEAQDSLAPDALPPDSGCAPGELLLESGYCQPAGLPPDMACPPGEWPSEDGTCQAAGIPPEACAEGFEPDGDRGCNAILPAETCPFGQMAVPGETSCREVAPCGDGPWGTIPVEANTQFVDQAYAGGDSDGTMAKPWTTVQQGVDAAADGVIVAVTDGVYEEDVVIEGKAVRLWGRCPARVEIRGMGVVLGAIVIIEADADGSVIRDLAVTGVGLGIVVAWASEVRIEQVWVHDAGLPGIEALYGQTSVRVQGSLVEQNHDVGVLVSGSDAEIEATVVRATQPLDGQYGWGISIGDEPDTTGERAKLGIRGSVVEQNHEAGVFISGSDAEIEATVVRTTQPVNGQLGRGIDIQQGGETGERAVMSIRGSVVEQNHGAGVIISGSDAEIEATVVRATQPVNGQFGLGIGIYDKPIGGERANANIRGCVVEQNHAVGVTVIGSNAELEATMVRDNQPVNGLGGRGISIEDSPDTSERANVGIRGSVVEQNHEVGVFVGGSDAELEATVVRDNQPVNGQHGVGISIEENPDTSERARVGIRRCVVERNHALGVSVAGSNAKIEETIVRTTQPENGIKGVGILIQEGPSAAARAKASIRGCVVEQNHIGGVFVFGSDAELAASVVRDTAASAEGSLGDGIVALNGTATIQSTTVSGNTRAGVSNFGSEVTILSSIITCNAFDLNGEAYEGIPFSFDGSADWQCSRADAEDCTETGACHVLSAGLAPPPPIEPL